MSKFDDTVNHGTGYNICDENYVVILRITFKTISPIADRMG